MSVCSIQTFVEELKTYHTSFIIQWSKGLFILYDSLLLLHIIFGNKNQHYFIPNFNKLRCIFIIFARIISILQQQQTRFMTLESGQPGDQAYKTFTIHTHLSSPH